MSATRGWCSLALVLWTAGCAGTRADAGLGRVDDLVGERLPHTLRWRADSEDDARARAEVDALLAAPLTEQAAVQVALLENRTLQAEYERLGLARADLVRAGLLHNPVFGASVRFPDGSASGTNTELSVVQDFLELLLRPGRRAIAETLLEEAELDVAAAVVALAAEVRAAYYTALGANQVSALRSLVANAAGASAELAQRLHAAGNLSDLELARELDHYEAARVAWARARTEAATEREHLTRLLGLWGPRTGYELPESLPDLPPQEPDLVELERRAVEGRLDLAAARKRSEALARSLGIARDWRLLPVLEVGLGAERELDGQWLVGPELSLELPLFDRGQADLMALGAELRQADQLVIALAVEVRSEVRAARDRLTALRRLVEHHRDVVIPLRESIVAHTQQEHDYMLVGAFELLAAKQAEYDGYQEYVEGVRDYWIARSELGRALGGDLAGARAPLEAGAPVPAQPEQARHAGHGDQQP